VVGWIVLGVVVLALVVLVAAVLTLLGRLRGLARALRRLQGRAADAERLMPAVTALQERAADMERQLRVIEERAALVRARRGGSA
jgi:hypothetical protein